MSHLRTFFEVFIPLFVAIDAFGLVPLFLAVTRGMTEEQRRRVTFQAVGTALVISVVFMFTGREIFRFLSITENDFRIAGGLLLLVLAVLDIVGTGRPSVHEPEIVGIVPLAMPLITGPAVLTTVLVLASRGQYGYAWTLAGLLANMLILLAAMLGAQRISRLLGDNALRAFSKLVMVLLAAIAVNFIRTGISNIIAR